MHARFILIPVLLSLAAAACSTTAESVRHERPDLWPQTGPSDPPAPLPQGSQATVDQYTAYALSRHPDLQAQHQAWTAALHDAQAQGTLPEPTLSLMASPLPIETRLGPQRARVGLRQTFPWPGQLQAQTRLATQGAQLEATRYAATMVALRGQIARAYWSLWGLQARAEVAAQQVTLMEAIVATLRSGLEVGLATTSALTQSNLELSLAHNRRQEIDANLQVARARLSASLGLADPAESLPIAPQPPPIALPTATLDALQAMAAQRPDVLLVSERLEQRARQVELASLRSRPSFGLGLEWAEVGGDPAGSGPAHAADAGRDALMITGQLSLPLWFGSYAASLDAAQARAQATHFELEAARLRSRALASERLALLNESARKATLFTTTLLPQAQAAVEAARTDEVAGRTGALETLRAHSRQLDLQLGLIDALTQHALDWVALEELVATPLQRHPASQGALP